MCLGVQVYSCESKEIEKHMQILVVIEPVD